MISNTDQKVDQQKYDESFDRIFRGKLFWYKVDLEDDVVVGFEEIYEPEEVKVCR